MPRKGRQLKVDLRKAGFFLDRQAGSHETWRHAAYPDVRVVLALKDGDDADEYEERLVRRAIAATRKEDEQ